MLKRIFNSKLVRFLFLTLAIVFFGFVIVYQGLSYERIQTIPSTNYIDQHLAEELMKISKEHSNPYTLEEMIVESQEFVSDKLSYSFHQTYKDPSKVLIEGKAHCVGYASGFVIVLNYFLKSSNFSEVKVDHCRGHLYLFGQNLNHLVNHPFFATHDYVEITFPRKNIKYIVDPSFNDFFNVIRIKRIDLGVKD